MPTATFLGHAAVEIRTGDHTILIDPFLTDNPQALVSADDVAADAILLTHGHGDHIGDTIAIAQRTGALVVANFEIADWLNRQGVENTHPMHLGGARQFDFGWVKLTIAFHGSGLPDGSYGGNPAGLLMKFGGKTLYHAGDTALFSDMQLIGDAGIDLAFLPIGDNFTMGPDDALRATEFLRANQVVPIHYNTWPPIEQDAQKWATDVNAKGMAKAIVLQPGESIEL